MTLPIIHQARAFSPGRGQDEGDTSWVPGFLDDLARELKRRVVAAGKSIQDDRRAALEILNNILFGPRALEDAPSSLNEVRMAVNTPLPPVIATSSGCLGWWWR